MSRIVHVITRFVNGGADENTLLTCNHQVAAGHEVWLVHGAESTERMVGLLDPRVKVVKLSSLVREVAPAGDLRALVGLIRLYRRIRPDIVHTHTSKAGFTGRLAAYAVPSARVVHGVHILPFTSEPFLKRTIYLALEKLAAFRTHAFIDVSEGMEALCLAHGLGNEANHVVIRSGMDIAAFSEAVPAEDVAALRAREPRGVVLGYVAVLERRKRHREMLEALIPILQARPEVALVLAGDGPERPFLEGRIREAGLEDRVRILGFREDVGRILAACDICVFASQREGLPRSVVQYVLAGKPVVAMALPGIERVVVDGENGFVIGSDDFGAFGEAVSKLADDHALRNRFAGSSAAMDLSEWDAAVMGARIQAVYDACDPTPPSSGIRQRVMNG